MSWKGLVAQTLVLCALLPLAGAAAPEPGADSLESAFRKDQDALLGVPRNQYVVSFSTSKDEWWPITEIFVREVAAQTNLTVLLFTFDPETDALCRNLERTQCFYAENVARHFDMRNDTAFPGENAWHKPRWLRNINVGKSATLALSSSRAFSKNEDMLFLETDVMVKQDPLLYFRSQYNGGDVAVTTAEKGHTGLNTGVIYVRNATASHEKLVGFMSHVLDSYTTINEQTAFLHHFGITPAQTVGPEEGFSTTCPGYKRSLTKYTTHFACIKSAHWKLKAIESFFDM